MLSLNQKKWLSLIPIVPGTLSIVGSLAILRSVVKQAKENRGTYERILFGMSILDIFMATSVVLTNFLKPPESEWPYSFGNHDTCTAIGVLYQISAFGTAGYAGALAMYYYLHIVRQHGKNIVERIEIWQHCAVLLTPSTFAIAGVVWDLYEPTILSGSCWLYCHSKQSVETRCGSWLAYLAALPFFVTLLVVPYCMTGLWLHVRRTTQRSNTYRFPSSISAKPDDASHLGERPQQLSGQFRVEMQVRSQAALYIAAYYTSSVFAATLHICELHVPFEVRQRIAGKLFPLMVIQACTLPSVGIFYSLIFFRGKLLMTRERYPRSTMLSSLAHALSIRKIQPDSVPQ